MMQSFRDFWFGKEQFHVVCCDLPLKASLPREKSRADNQMTAFLGLRAKQHPEGHGGLRAASTCSFLALRAFQL